MLIQKTKERVVFFLSFHNCVEVFEELQTTVRTAAPSLKPGPCEDDLRGTLAKGCVNFLCISDLQQRKVEDSPSSPTSFQITETKPSFFHSSASPVFPLILSRGPVERPSPELHTI